MARLSAVYSTLVPNASLVLYEGPMEIGSGGEPPVIGTIAHEWLPSPKARFHIPDAGHYLGEDDLTLSLPSSNIPTPVLATSTTMGSHIPTSISGLLNGPMEFGPRDALYSLVFHLTNFEKTWIRRDDTPPGRLTDEWEPGDIFLTGDGWDVKIEAVPHLDELERGLKRVGGFAVTHVGRIGREDGSPFDAEEAERMLGVLRYFLSFVQGYWVALILPVGYAATGQKRWEQWGSWRLDSWRSRESWFDAQHGECLQAAFQGFLNRWHDSELWHDPIRRALHWYIEANRGGGDVEAFIVLSQAALELLAETVCVEVEKTATAAAFDKRSAHRKIRELLAWSDIPTELPYLCAGLTRVVPALEFTDGPAAFTSVRNWIGHATKMNRERYGQLRSESINDTWRLGLRYLELVLLYIIDYQGPYANRLVHPRSVGTVETVPWAKS